MDTSRHTELCWIHPCKGGSSIILMGLWFKKKCMISYFLVHYFTIHIPYWHKFSTKILKTYFKFETPQSICFINFVVSVLRWYNINVHTVWFGLFISFSYFWCTHHKALRFWIALANTSFSCHFCWCCWYCWQENNYRLGTQGNTIFLSDTYFRSSVDMTADMLLSTQYLYKHIKSLGF